MEWFMQFFAMSFLTVCVQMLLAIFSGIIIDSFGELRDRHAEITSHLNEQGHLLSHNTHRHYVHFFVFLLCAGSNTSELTDLEDYIYGQVVERESSEWLPYRHGLEPQKQQVQSAKEERHADQSVDIFREQLGALTRRVEDLCSRFDRFEARTGQGSRGGTGTGVSNALSGSKVREDAEIDMLPRVLSSSSLGLPPQVTSPCYRVDTSPKHVLSGPRGGSSPGRGAAPPGLERRWVPENHLASIGDTLLALRCDMQVLRDHVMPPTPCVTTPSHRCPTSPLPREIWEQTFRSS
mmetsp:Transcript_104886/g.271699  ORF Transcript_104886/g.271699 Transcript_104886/m.271699 type:complete len:293 (+) Transcript_104886:2-880(+)